MPDPKRRETPATPSAEAEGREGCRLLRTESLKYTDLPDELKLRPSHSIPANRGLSRRKSIYFTPEQFFQSALPVFLTTPWRFPLGWLQHSSAGLRVLHFGSTLCRSAFQSSSNLPASTRLPRPEWRLNRPKMGSISPWFGRRILPFYIFWNPPTQTFE